MEDWLLTDNTFILEEELKQLENWDLPENLILGEKLDSKTKEPDFIIKIKSENYGFYRPVCNICGIYCNNLPYRRTGAQLIGSVIYTAKCKTHFREKKINYEGKTYRYQDKLRMTEFKKDVAKGMPVYFNNILMTEEEKSIMMFPEGRKGKRKREN